MKGVVLVNVDWGRSKETVFLGLVESLGIGVATSAQEPGAIGAVLLSGVAIGCSVSCCGSAVA